MGSELFYLVDECPTDVGLGCVEDEVEFLANVDSNDISLARLGQQALQFRCHGYGVPAEAHASGVVTGGLGLGNRTLGEKLIRCRIKAVGGYDDIRFEPLAKVCLRDDNPRLYIFLVLDDLLALKHGDAKPLHLSY